MAPRSTLEYLQRIAESDKVDWFVVGGVPLSPHPFRLVNITDEWDVVLIDGVLISCKVGITIEEYL